MVERVAEVFSLTRSFARSPHSLSHTHTHTHPIQCIYTHKRTEPTAQVIVERVAEALRHTLTHIHPLSLYTPTLSIHTLDNRANGR